MPSTLISISSPFPSQAYTESASWSIAAPDPIDTMADGNEGGLSNGTATSSSVSTTLTSILTKHTSFGSSSPPLIETSRPITGIPGDTTSVISVHAVSLQGFLGGYLAGFFTAIALITIVVIVHFIRKRCRKSNADVHAPSDGNTYAGVLGADTYTAYNGGHEQSTSGTEGQRPQSEYQELTVKHTSLHVGPKQEQHIMPTTRTTATKVTTADEPYQSIEIGPAAHQFSSPAVSGGMLEDEHVYLNVRKSTAHMK